MSEISRLTNISVSSETGWGVLNRKWKSIRFLFEKRTFESKLEGLLRPAAGHEGNSLPPGDHQYQLLNAEADSLCSEFAERWGLQIELLKARIAGVAKLERLSVPPPTMNYTRIACLATVAIPLAFLLMGAVVGLFNVGFHLVGGR
jgi:hypothetical protein